MVILKVFYVLSIFMVSSGFFYVLLWFILWYFGLKTSCGLSMICSICFCFFLGWSGLL